MSVEPTHRRFVSYIDKSRAYYAAQGYDTPYRWARPEQPPALHRLPRSLASLRLGLITTAFPLADDGKPPTTEVPYAQTVDSAPTTGYTADLNRDTSAAPATDLGSYLPLGHLDALAVAGRVGSLSSRFYGVPFDYSQRRTIEQDAPALLEFLRADEVEAAVIVPHCPVCHQSAALTARHLEANAIPTVLVGSARDIVEEIGVPRFLFTDLPLGYPLGRPGDGEQQQRVCEQALDLLEHATAPRTTVHADVDWGDEGWRSAYMRVDDTTRSALSAAGAERRDDQQQAKRSGRTRTT